MPADNVETVRRFIAAVNAADRSAAFDCLAPDVIWNATGELTERPHYHGREEVWDWVRSFEGLQVELDSVTVVGSLVVARVRLGGSSGESEPDLEFSSVARFRDGRIARVQNYVDHDEAMNDAELKSTG